ncbi:phenylacetate--CoA ligase family protein [Parabacteroides sp. AF17-28]|uniref:phenylacetate--CoA ligase family protein n=1 Tax=Parabacteroides sp. AF17-28 TaxID=2292241 RepID=UPI0011C3DC00|nr:phenylacetate--CoA ligase family protein [Parabacteroides sp. AF17-28]
MEESIFWLKNKLLRKAAMRQYEKALLSDTLFYEELRDLNWEKRKSIVVHAYNHSAFYKCFYDEHNFNPSMLHTEEDWNKVPILEKEDVRKFREEIRDVSVPSKYVGVATTGGSTGMPLKVYTDKRFHFEILGWRAFRWWGVSPADHVGIIHRSVPSTFLSKLINRCMWWPTRRAYLNASSIMEEDISEFVHSLISQQTKWIVGYVGGIEKVVDYILANNIHIESVRLIWSTSAPLLDFVRKKIERAFNCKVMDQYGCCEVAHIAIECPHCKGFHVNSDYVHVDIMNKKDKTLLKPGESGDILITNLEGRVFPLIKYRLGDTGSFSLSKCNCGLPYPLLNKVVGRTSDSIYTPSGLMLESAYLSTIFDDYTDFVYNFRIYQSENYAVTIYVVVNKMNKTEVEHVIQMIKKELSLKTKNEIPISFECMDKIENDRGKNRYIISEVALALNKK